MMAIKTNGKSEIIALKAIIIVSILSISSAQKECFRINSGGLASFCCDNHVRKNGGCIECGLGTKSKNEEPCTPCSQGTYGRKCLYPCNCKMLERCDIVIGCVSNNESSVLSETGHTTGNTTDNQNTARVIAGPSKTELYLYSAGSGGLLLLLLIIVLIIVCRRKTKSQNQQITFQNDNPNTEEIDSANTDSLYESIDESNLCEDIIQIRNTNASKMLDMNLQPESELSSIKSENSGYLHPYTTLTERKETHLYFTPTNSSTNSGMSCFSENVKRDSEYTHPYNQLQQDNAQLRTAKKSEYTQLTAVYYLELVDVHYNIGSASRADLPDCKNSTRNSCEGEGNERVDPMRHSPLDKCSSVQHVQSPFAISSQDLTNDDMSQAVKHNSI